MARTGNSLFSFASLGLLALPVTAASAQPQPQPTAPKLPYEYAVKFVCGTNPIQGAVSTAAAPGNYFVAVNIHNPQQQGNEFTYKVVLANMNPSPPQMTQFQPFAGLKYDWAFDIECRLIRARLQQAGFPVPAPGFITGFLVIQAVREIDVVAVYTAAPAGGQVASVHTERVPFRKVM